MKIHEKSTIVVVASAFSCRCAEFMFLLDSIPNASDQPVSSPTVSDRTDPIRVVLPQLISYVFDLTI